MTNEHKGGIVIDNPGMCSIIVDRGRSDGQDRGFSESGPLDEEAYFWANWLCGNDDNESVIECIGSLEITAKVTSTMAVTGPEANITVNNDAVPLWQTFSVQANDKITISAKCPTSKLYIAVGGTWLLPKSMGSTCTVIREGIGGLSGDGKPLKSEDTILIRASGYSKRQVPPLLQPDYMSAEPVDVIPGYQYSSFNSLAIRRFFSSGYTLTPDINRMGYRLKGAAVTSSKTKMRSEGINFGAIQFPQDGQPIIMLRDRQTLGGYPKIGCVAPYDIPRLVQTSVDEIVSFKACDASDARTNWLLAYTKRQRHISGK